MAVTPVAGGQPAAATDSQASAQSDEAQLQAAFTSVVGSIALPMVMQQMNFSKQIIDQASEDNND